jgi:integrase
LARQSSRPPTLEYDVFDAVARRMERSDLTAHGFRSTFRDWVSETTDFPGEVAEMALDHVIANKVEAAYGRSDLLAKRRELMETWAAYCARR